MLKQKLLLNFSSKLLTQGLQFVSMIIVARFAGPSTVGILSFGLSFIAMFNFIGTLGFGSAHIKIYNETDLKADALSTYSWLHFGAKTLFVSVIIGYYLLQKYFLGFRFESSEHEIVIFIFLLASFLNTFSDIPKTTFMANTEQAKVDVPDFIRNNIFNGLRIMIAILGGTAVLLSTANLFSAILAIPMYHYMYRGYKHGKFNKGLAKKYFNYGLPLVVISITAGLAGNLDIVLLQHFSNSTQVGYYSVGTRMASYFLVVASSLGSLLFPTFSKFVSENAYSKISEKIAQSDRIIQLYFLPLVLLLAIYAHSFVVLVFGPKYSSTDTIFTLAALGAYFRLLSISYGSLITGLGEFGIALLTNIIPLMILITLLYLFISPEWFDFGGVGAVVSVLLMNISQSLLFRYYAAKKFPGKLPRTDITLLIVQLGIGGSMALIYYFIFHNQHYYINLLFPILYLSVNYGTLRYSRLLRDTDIQFIKDLLSPRIMKKYITKEVLKK